MLLRFKVFTENPDNPKDRYYWIKDQEANTWNMPVKAVSINFGTMIDANSVAMLLNVEWARFLRNPK